MLSFIGHKQNQSQEGQKGTDQTEAGGQQKEKGEAGGQREGYVFGQDFLHTLS